MKKTADMNMMKYFIKLYGRFKRLLWLDGLMALVIVLSLAFALMFISDAIFILPQSFRQSCVLILGLIAVGFLLYRGNSIRKMSPLNLARMCENNDVSLGSSLTNALQLQELRETSGVSEVLRRQAMEYGADKAKKIRLAPLLGPTLKRTAIVMSSALLVWLSGYLVFSSFFQSILPRFYDPAGDHPPYSRLHIEVAIDKNEIVYGDKCEIRATATGLPVDKLFLVTKTANGDNRTVMFRRPDGSYFFTLTSLRAPATFWITNGRARSRRFDLAVLPTPIIKEIEVETVFPEYTGQKAFISSLSDMRKQLPLRSSLNFTIRSNRPLKGGMIELTPLLGGETRTISLKKVKGEQNKVTGGFILEKPTAFSLNIIDVDGRLSQNPARSRVTVAPDHLPRIFIEEPGIQALATPEITIPIRVRCEDDYGISAVRLFRGYNQSIEYPASMELQKLKSSRGAVAEGSFDFKDLGVRPGDMVNYYLEALDNNPDGPGLTLSRIFTIQIISEDQYHHIVKNMKRKKALFELYFQVERHLNRLAKRAEDFTQKLRQESEKGQEKTDDLCREHEQFQSSMQEYDSALQKLFSEEPATDIEGDFRAKLYTSKIAFEMMRKRFDLMSAKANPACVINVEEMTALLDDISLMRGEVERDVINPAKQIAAVVNILALAQDFSKMAESQMDISRLAHRFQNKSTPPSRIEQLEMSELKARQEKIRVGLFKLTRRLTDLIESLPQEKEFEELRLSVRQFLAAVEELDIQTDLNNSVENWQTLKGSMAYLLSKSGAEKMQKLLQQSGQMGQAGKQCLKFMPGMKNAPGGALEQLLSSIRGDVQSTGSSDGYGMYDENVGLYGPDMKIPGASNGSGEEGHGRSSQSTYQITSHDSPAESDRKKQQEVKLPDGLEFPLRYRQLVGDYFRAIAESVQKETSD